MRWWAFGFHLVREEEGLVVVNHSSDLGLCVHFLLTVHRLVIYARHLLSMLSRFRRLKIKRATHVLTKVLYFAMYEIARKWRGSRRRL